MTVQAAIALGVAAALGAYLGLLLFVAARRRRLRIEAVRQALLRQKRRAAGVSVQAGLGELLGH